MSSRFQRPAALLALLLAASLALPAQTVTPLNDPANLAGERVSPQDPADTLPINHGALALQQLLRKLRTRASFMLIVAHPDDEDGGMLTYLSRGQGARVAMLTLNRGEGGQNLMSADFEDALGLIRTQELLAADRYMAVDQFFGTEVDFGFSKTKEESFAKWTHERVLYDAVRAVRLYRPLVIASVFIGATSDGHGQHQVAGEIAQEVFNAAGDPNIFPDQIAAGLQPWQPLKVYARVPFARIDAQGIFDTATNQYTPARFTNYVTGKVTSTIPNANVVVPEGTPDPLLGGPSPGTSYVQFARQGLALQKSQVGATARPAAAGRADVSYHRYGTHLLGPDGKPQPDGDDSGLEASFFDGIDTTLPGIASLAPEVAARFRPGLAKINQQIAEAQRLFDPTKPELTAPPLRLALGAVDDFVNELESLAVNDLPAIETYNLLHELRIKRVQLNNALALAVGLKLSAEIPNANNSTSLLSDQKTVAVDVKASSNADKPVALSHLGLSLAGSEMKSAPAKVETIASHSSVDDHISGESSSGLPPTRPYFSRPNIEQPYYDISDPSLRNAPATPSPLVVHAQVDYNGVPITIEAAVTGSSNADISHSAVIVPPVSVALDRRVEILPSDKKNLQFRMYLNPPGTTAVAANLNAPTAWKTLPTAGLEGQPGSLPFSFDVPPAGRKLVTLQATVKLKDGHTFSEGYRPVGYPGLVYTNYYTPATVRIVPIDLTTAPNLRVAYLPGTGDDIPAYLPDLGITPTILTLADLTPARLSQFDAVILGVRAYTAHPELAGAGSKPLLDYAAAGGVVIVQYNNGHFGDVEAPYPITTPASSGDHAHDVVDESQPVTLLAPDSPLLTFPNRITSADFDGWVAERGHAFAGTWAPQYQPLLESHDPGQPPQQGGLLAARVGKGYYIYCAYALFRQLPEGVPGAYRLFANLITAGKNPAAPK